MSAPDFSFEFADGVGDGYNNIDVSIRAELLPAPLEECKPSWCEEAQDKKSEKRTTSPCEMDASTLKNQITQMMGDLMNGSIIKESKEKMDLLFDQATAPIKTIKYTQYYETVNKEITNTAIKAEINGYLLTFGHKEVVRD
eukprot:gnl/MRDRNA2_/MRDRNA2_191923_c0_seq1.p1 gnl/MRDRNA2_/MRDRNA2_191923_c0~~gnl/MRDRNA2_/MRDRNA2_191923_c0_seq1.p1  ORF type:complete len:141 (-),score=26.00 gnl/MRDRNA2_/MRDRNA2_191923_c0_seq1:107-529(-)